MLHDVERPLQPAIVRAMSDPRVAPEAEQRIRRVLYMLKDDVTPEFAPSYPCRDAFASTIVQTTLERFDRAFDRWRSLFVAGAAA